MNSTASWLLAALFAAHFLGDFTPLATRRMHEAKSAGGPVGPILGHAVIHGLLVAPAGILLSSTPWTAGLAAAGFVLGTHFLLDLARARAGRQYPVLTDPGKGAFWTALGADQLGHALVLILVAGWLT